MIKTIFTKLFR